MRRSFENCEWDGPGLRKLRSVNAGGGAVFARAVVHLRVRGLASQTLATLARGSPSEARRRRAKDGGPDFRQIEPIDQLDASNPGLPESRLRWFAISEVRLRTIFDSPRKSLIVSQVLDQPISLAVVREAPFGGSRGQPPRRNVAASEIPVRSMPNNLGSEIRKSRLTASQSRSFSSSAV
jgi:hypothetical protein